jgi:hypothetical protein
MLAVKLDGSRNIAGLELAEALFVAVAHDLPPATRMVQTNRMPDLVRKCIA